MLKRTGAALIVAIGGTGAAFASGGGGEAVALQKEGRPRGEYGY
jgi:hypothetical protein